MAFYPDRRNCCNATGGRRMVDPRLRSLYYCLMTLEQEDSDARAARRAAPIEFRLDLASGVPTYLQLVHQVEHTLRLGYLVPGDQLPKVRDVVAEPRSTRTPC